jgi:hypothetical protein
MRTLLLLAIALSLPAATQEDCYYNKALAFEKHWNKCARELFGCPPAGNADDGNCHASQGTLDAREFELARIEAMKLFDLKDAREPRH